MSELLPHGATRDVQYVFSKVFVRDLDAMAAFYEAVFGLVRSNRHQDEMGGRPIDEISFMATSAGGPGLTLIRWVDGEVPAVGESVQGFTTPDVEALVARAEGAGGRLAEPIRRIEAFALRVAFVLDPEGHLNEVVQLDG